MEDHGRGLLSAGKSMVGDPFEKAASDLLVCNAIRLYVQWGVSFEWDAAKARENVRNHNGVRFEESRAVFDDPHAITIADDESDPFEKRFVSIGMGALGRVLVVVYTYRDDNIRIISARLAMRHERAGYET
jgi:uncharacterized DUF497 family protein